jgi:hypothetical protein
MREDNDSWKLPSNRGWNTTSWFIRGEAEIDVEKFLLVEVVMTGKYWNRFKHAQNKGVDYAREYSLVMPQFLISVSRLKDLLERMAAYLKTPIDQMAHNPPNISEELCWLDGQTFRIEFGLRNGFVYGVGQCVCTISYELAALSGECAYVVDPTCMQVMVDGIENYFRLTLSA